jgi:hypothetical protein
MTDSTLTREQEKAAIAKEREEAANAKPVFNEPAPQKFKGRTI